MFYYSRGVKIALKSVSKHILWTFQKNTCQFLSRKFRLQSMDTEQMHEAIGDGYKV